MKKRLVSRNKSLFLLISVSILLLAIGAIFTLFKPVPAFANEISIEETPFTIDFSLGLFDLGLQQAIYDFLSTNSARLPEGIYEFTVTVQYTDQDGTQHITLLPSKVYESHWDLPLQDDQIIRLAIHPKNVYESEITFSPLPEIANSPTVDDYRFPWTGGDTWLKTQGFHYNNLGYSLDFIPNGSVPSVRAIETGLLTAMCYISSDPYQGMVRVAHPDGPDSGYLHLTKTTIPAGLFNTQIPRGEYLGDLFNEDVTYNPHPDCGDPSQYLYATACGCGTAMHLHFETTSLIPIQGIPLQTISDAPYRTPYTSTNYAPDSTPPTLSLPTLPSSHWYNTDQPLTFSATDDSSGVDHLLWAWDNPTPTTQINGGSGSTTLLAAGSQGQHTLFLQACDVQGNCTSVQSSGWYGYDITPPTGNPEVNQGQTVNNINIPLNSNGLDTPSGVATVRVSNDGSTFEALSYAPTVIWTLLGLNRDFNPVWVQMVDAAGNPSPVYPLEVCLNLYPAPPSSTNYRLWSAGPHSAAGAFTSNNYQLVQTVGQTPSGGMLMGTGYQLLSGFLSTLDASPSSSYYRPFECGVEVQNVFLPNIVR